MSDERNREYITPQGKPTDIERDYICEQIVNIHLSIIYLDTDEDKKLLEDAASRYGRAEDASQAISISRAVVQGCQINKNSCTNKSCSGSCEFKPGPSFKTCKCNK